MTGHSKKRFTDEFYESMDWVEYTEITEKEGVKVDGIAVIGRVKGPFFKVGESLNRRYYSRKLWEKAISNSRGLLEKGMVGALGHEQPLDENAFSRGLISHKITNISLGADDIGIGEALILNTESGRNLNTYLRSGIKLAVSSRAFGDYNGETNTGAEIVDEDKYVLEGWDFVRNPGIVEAVPKLVEGYLNIEETSMSDNTIVETLTKEKIELSEKIGSMASTLCERNKEVEGLKADKASLEGKIDSLEKQLESISSSAKELEEAKASLSNYSNLGTFEELSKLLNTSDQLETKFEKFGGFEKAFELLEAYSEHGTVDDFQRLIEMVQDYTDLGTPEDVERTFSLTESYLDNIKNKEKEKQAKELASQYGVSENHAASLIENLGREEAEKFVKELREKEKVSHLYSVKDEKGPTDSTKEDTSPLITESRTNRLFKQFNR